jgi:DNA-binding transcriptional LysR family regulator
MNFDRLRLEPFDAIAVTRHYGNAATTLNVTPGMVSQRFRVVEEAIGPPKLVRERNVPLPARESLNARSPRDTRS